VGCLGLPGNGLCGRQMCGQNRDSELKPGPCFGLFGVIPKGCVAGCCIGCWARVGGTRSSWVLWWVYGLPLGLWGATIPLMPTRPSANGKLTVALLFGQPGVGKGTQGQVMGSIPGLVHLATGDMFRGLDHESELGKKFLEFSSQGLLVPDDLTCRLWQQYVQGLIDTNAYRPHMDLLMLDGIPRSVPQAELLAQHIDVLTVVHLMCPDEEKLVHRIKRRAQKQGRLDDADESVIRRRLEVYNRETKPVLDFYDPSIVHNVDATGLPMQVTHRVLSKILPAVESRLSNPLGA
jgi:adenylate kinase